MNIKEKNQWDDEVYLIATTDPVQGGENGVDNLPHQQLANRTVWLKNQIQTLIQRLIVVEEILANIPTSNQTSNPITTSPTTTPNHQAQTKIFRIECDVVTSQPYGGYYVDILNIRKFSEDLDLTFIPGAKEQMVINTAEDRQKEIDKMQAKILVIDKHVIAVNNINNIRIGNIDTRGTSIIPEISIQSLQTRIMQDGIATEYSSFEIIIKPKDVGVFTYTFELHIVMEHP